MMKTMLLAGTDGVLWAVRMVVTLVMLETLFSRALLILGFLGVLWTMLPKNLVLLKVLVVLLSTLGA